MDDKEVKRTVSGKCGEKLTYNFENGVLSIDGEGTMFNKEELPWRDWLDEIQELSIGSGCEIIGDGAFEECVNLRSVQLPDGLKVIGKESFRWCFELWTVKFPSSLHLIREGAFFQCSNLHNVEIPLDVWIEPEAFALCEKLDDRYAYNDLNYDYNSRQPLNRRYPFGKDLPYRVIGNTVCIQGRGRMYDFCTEYESIWESGLQSRPAIDDAERVTIAPGCTYIGRCAFVECGMLRNVSIPDTVTEIGERAFDECDELTDLEIPDSVIKIGRDAFKGVPHIIYHGPAQSDDNWGALSRN